MSDLELARVPRGQLSLFARPTVREVLARYGLQPRAVRPLFYDGVLSFEPEPDRRLHPADEAELDFLGALTRLAGPRGVVDLLSGLTAPYAYRLDLLELDVRDRRWRLREPPSLDALDLPRAG